MTSIDEPTTDGRLLRGQRTRRIVLRAAVDAASLDGLDGVTFGRMSTMTGQSKPGVQTLFRTKETLQLATAEFAAAMFTDFVVVPTQHEAPGLPRLRALVDRWLRYASEPLFAGGCFWTATIAEYDSRPGPLRDLLLAHRRAWRGTLEREVERAVASGEVTDRDAALTAFQIDAVLQATNLELRLGEPDAANRARAAVDSILGNLDQR